MTTPDAAGIEAALAAGLAAHAPRTQPPMGLVVGCSCGWRIGRTMYEGYDTHVAAALLPVVTQAQAEALREAADEFAEGAWNGAFAAGDVEDDESAVRAVYDSLRARADESGAK